MDSLALKCGREIMYGGGGPNGLVRILQMCLYRLLLTEMICQSTNMQEFLLKLMDQLWCCKRNDVSGGTI